LLIQGEIEFPSEDETFSNAALTVTLQDTREADAPALVLKKQVTKRISRTAGSSEPLRFTLQCEDCPDSRFVTVSVLLDLDGDGCVSRGDYINVESYPVEPSPRKMRIRVHRVK
jgi:uncharacterized lipoprotein YbaY